MMDNENYETFIAKYFHIVGPLEERVYYQVIDYIANGHFLSEFARAVLIYRIKEILLDLNYGRDWELYEELPPGPLKKPSARNPNGMFKVNFPEKGF